MGISELLKRSWEITWRFKYLWVLGFFAVGPGLADVSYQSNLGDISEVAPDLAAIEPVVIVGVITVAVFFALVFVAVAIAASAGLVHAVSEADDGREVGFGAAWGAGFSLWGRIFLLGLLFVAASLMIGLAMAVVAVVGTVLCCLLPLVFVATFAVAFFLDSWWELSLRYAVVEDYGALDALANGGRTFFREWRQVIVVWLVLWLIGLVLAALFIVPVAVILLIGLSAGPTSPETTAFWVWVALASGIVGLLAMVPFAIARTWFSATWTVFFKELTMRPAVETGVAGVPPASGAYGMPPPPPYDPAPGGPSGSQGIPDSAPPPPPSSAPDAAPPPPPSGDAPPPSPSGDTPPPPPWDAGAPSGGS